MTGHHRKHGIRLLGKPDDDADATCSVGGRRIYDEAVREAVIVIWEAADRICGERLKAALHHLVESMERHGHLALDPEVRERLLAASAATLDHLLKPIRPTPAAGANAGVDSRWENAFRYGPSPIGMRRVKGGGKTFHGGDGGCTTGVMPDSFSMRDAGPSSRTGETVPNKSRLWSLPECLAIDLAK